MRRLGVAPIVVLVGSAVLAACGGGGGGGSSVSAPPPVTPTPTTAPTYTVAGTVVQIPNDAYGPATIAGVQYSSADANSTVPLSGATVVIGPIPIAGATPPPSLPAGDVVVTTNAAGAFSATVGIAPSAPSTLEPFVVPQVNLSGFAIPPYGYYVQVFAASADGRSAGIPIPLHRFYSVSSSLVLRLSSPTNAEAAALVEVNADRASSGSGPLIFDEDEQEVARLHATDESGVTTYTCHYDTKNAGPESRYLSLGGIGQTGESVVLAGASSSTIAFQVAESGFLSEKNQTPPGGHYLNLVDASKMWAGLAAVQSAQFSGFWNVDQEFGTPSAQNAAGAATGYATGASCPSGTVVNQS